MVYFEHGRKRSSDGALTKIVITDLSQWSQMNITNLLKWTYILFEINCTIFALVIWPPCEEFVRMVFFSFLCTLFLYQVTIRRHFGFISVVLGRPKFSATWRDVDMNETKKCKLRIVSELKVLSKWLYLFVCKTEGSLLTSICTSRLMCMFNENY